jgi:hypothetical protein
MALANVTEEWELKGVTIGKAVSPESDVSSKKRWSGSGPAVFPSVEIAACLSVVEQ